MPNIDESIVEVSISPAELSSSTDGKSDKFWILKWFRKFSVVAYWIGLPGTSGFVGEYLTLLAVYSKNTMVAFISTLGVILSASYMLKLYKRVFLGGLSENLDKKKDDINIYEICLYVVLVILIFIIGIKPGFILNYTTASLERIIQLYPISIF